MVGMFSFWEKPYWTELSIAILKVNYRYKHSLTVIKYASIRKLKKQSTFCGTPSLSCRTSIGKI